MTAEPIDDADDPPAPATTPPPAAPPARLCVCGHDAEAHEHYRPGDDCGACGPQRCRRFQRDRGRTKR